jgi:hypothetical protein
MLLYFLVRLVLPITASFQKHKSRDTVPSSASILFPSELTHYPLFKVADANNINF